MSHVEFENIVSSVEAVNPARMGADYVLGAASFECNCGPNGEHGICGVIFG